MTSALRNLTKGSAQTDAEDDVRWVRVSGLKGQPLTAAAVMGMENTGSDG